MTQLARAVRDSIARATPERAFGRLKESFRFIVTKQRVTIYSVYYWARFANDGRRAITGKTMMFFRDPEDDPRVDGDYPRKRATRRRLTREEAKNARDEGLLIVTQSVASAPPMKFIQAGVAEARKIVPEKMRERIRGDVRSLIKRRRDKITVRL